MKALTFQGEGDVKVTDVPKPAIERPGEALIKVTMGRQSAARISYLSWAHAHEPGSGARP